MPKQEKSPRQLAAEIAGRRALSRQELERKLARKGAAEAEIQGAVDWLEDIGAIDDASYAAMVVRHCARKSWGAARAREELRRRGVPRDLWDAALEELPNASEAAQRFLETKLRSALPNEQVKKRLTDALLRRGFSWNDVKSAWGQLGVSLPEDE